MRATLVVLAAGLALAPRPASAQLDTGAVGVAWDSLGLVCNLGIGAGEEATLYVLAYPEGIFGSGITGSEFRVDG